MNKDNKLQEELSFLNDRIAEDLNLPSSSQKFEVDCFTDIVLKILDEHSILSTPDFLDEAKGEFIRKDKCNVKIGQKFVRVDGVSLLENDENTYTLHLFATDYKPQDFPSAIESKEIGHIYNHALNFYLLSKDGTLERRLENYDILDSVRAIEKYQHYITAIRVWILTNRVSKNYSAGRKNEFGIEISAKVIDLSFLSDLNEGNGPISQRFEEMGGIKYVEVGDPSLQGYRCFLTAINADILARLYSAHGTALVQANVRAFLGMNKANKKIVETIQESPFNFVAFNNGLVIYSDNGEIADGRIMGLQGIQIINGGQTTASIYQTWLSTQAKKNIFVKERILENIKNVFVPAKIIIPVEDKIPNKGDFQAKISEAANTQTNIVSSDLSAHEPFHKAFEEISKRLKTATGGWFYERARGSYMAELKKRVGNKAAQRKFQNDFPQSKLVQKTDIALSDLAWKGFPEITAKGKQEAFKVFNSKMGDTIPSENDVKKYLMQWMIFSNLEKALKEEEAIRNPRVPVAYTISIFSSNFSKRLNWEILWQRQEPTQSLISLLKQLAKEVDRLIRMNMGSRMIQMYGRKEECKEKVLQEINIEDFAFETCFLIK